MNANGDHVAQKTKRSSKRKSKNKQPDLYLLGIGIGGAKAMTIETLDAIKSARIVFDMSDKPHIMKGLNPNQILLDDVYWSHRPFWDVYDELIQIVLDEVEKGPGVALVSYGHPLVFDSVNLELKKQCKRRGKSVKILPGTCCLDTIFIDLGIDLIDGLQIYEANDLVESRIAMNPKINSLVLQVGYFDVENAQMEYEFPPKHFAPLIKHISKYYRGKKQMVTLVHSDDGDGAELIRTRLSNLNRVRNRILTSMTMFVPAS